MSVWSKLRGTIETIFQLGLGGPQIKNNAGAFEMRNLTDSAFVITRGLTPVAANDYATKAYVDSGGGSGAIVQLDIPITTASTTSVDSLPANAVITECTVQITTTYSGGTTISVGQSGGSATLFQLTTDNLPTTTVLPSFYTVNQLTTAAGAPATVSVTIGGAPGAGVGVVIVKYSEPLS